MAAMTKLAVKKSSLAKNTKMYGVFSEKVRSFGKKMGTSSNTNMRT